MQRRAFLKAAAATALITSLGQKLGLAAASGEMPYRTLGATGERVSLLGIGGAHIGLPRVPEQVALGIIRSALDAGVNFLDNCWDYNDGVSELRMGKALRDGYRAKAFLMTKVNGRTAADATQQLDECLRRLQTDHLDLIQIHDVSQLEDADKVFAPGGAIEALSKAKEAGKVRYIGFTGHRDADMHLRMLEVADRHQFTFDAVQMPLNVMDAHFESFCHQVLPVLTVRNIGVLGMKPMGDKSILRSNTVTPVDCLRFAMNLPVSVCITGCDSLDILRQGLDVATNFKPLDATQVQAILAKAEAAAAHGDYEPYKTAWYPRKTPRS